jgi:acyl dehydratase
MKGMGRSGPATLGVHAAGLVPPDLLAGMTLHLLAHQPPLHVGERASGGRPPASPIAGGVWVRERYTVHRPLDRDDRFAVTGAAVGRHVRKGRRYGTTSSMCHDQAGRRVTTNLTTGLLAYRAEEGLADTVEGVAPDDAPAPRADRDAASANPHDEALRTAQVGEELGGEPVVVSLAMMAARDTTDPDNPIHSDPEEARRAGLDRPIAGGSHVLAFALEPVIARFGARSLLHGTHVDVRWRAPAMADETIVPTALVSRSDDDTIELALRVDLADGTAAMVGTVTVPLMRR